MKRGNPWNDRVDVEISSDESSPSDADMKINVNPGINLPDDNITVDAPAVDKISEADVMIRKAKLYQDYMKQISISTRRGSIIPFSTWMGLASSIKQLYGQPLHYLTNIHLKQWDQSRLGAENEYRPLDSIIDPRKAEANIWLMEEVHRQTTSHHYLAKLWLSDPMHEAFIDSIFPLL